MLLILWPGEVWDEMSTTAVESLLYDNMLLIINFSDSIFTKNLISDNCFFIINHHSLTKIYDSTGIYLQERTID